MFEGVLTALVTPFRNGEIDEPALREHIELQIAGGVQGLVPCGSTGESATMSHAEHIRVIGITVDAAAGRVPVVAGTGSNNTREAIELTQHAKDAGADGALLITPYYNKPTQEGIFAHYEEVARLSALPLMLYNIPGRTASNLTAATMARLAEVEHVVGVKESSGDLTQVAELIAHTPEDFAVVSGDDALTLPMLALGGQGVISTTANVAPAEMVELVSAFRGGDPERARRSHYRLLPLFEALFLESNPIPVKAALHMLGRIGPELRLPLVPMTDANRQRHQVVLKELGLL